MEAEPTDFPSHREKEAGCVTETRGRGGKGGWQQGAPQGSRWVSLVIWEHRLMQLSWELRRLGAPMVQPTHTLRPRNCPPVHTPGSPGCQHPGGRTRKKPATRVNAWRLPKADTFLFIKGKNCCAHPSRAESSRRAKAGRPMGVCAGSCIRGVAGRQDLRERKRQEGRL